MFSRTKDPDVSMDCVPTDSNSSEEWIKAQGWMLILVIFFSVEFAVTHFPGANPHKMPR